LPIGRAPAARELQRAVPTPATNRVQERDLPEREAGMRE